MKSLKCSSRIKIGISNKEAISSLIATKVIGPTSGAATFINKNEAPHVAPIDSIKNQSIKFDLLIM